MREMMKKKKHKFQLVPIAWFDARRGYKRWVLPGVGIPGYYTGYRRFPNMSTDIWVAPAGHLVTRFEANDYQLSFKIKLKSGRKITPQMEMELAEFLWAMLREWEGSGIDDTLDCDGVDFEGD
jgi:hypothetical protein